MIERILILPDVHITQNGYSKAYALAREFTKYYKPHETVLLGDFMECEAVCHWIENKRRLVENKRLLKEYAVANQELDWVQKYSRRVVYLEGNHENWVEQYIDKHPEVEGLLELSTNLRLGKRGIRFVPLNNLYRKGRIHFLHGVYINKFHALKHLTRYGCCLCYGHTHTAQTAQLNMKMMLPIMAYGLGCLCDHAPAYLKGRPSNWICQLAVMECNTKTGRFNLTPINITDNQFIYNGKEWK